MKVPLQHLQAACAFSSRPIASNVEGSSRLIACFYTAFRRMLYQNITSAGSMGCMLPLNPGESRKREEQWNEEEVCIGLSP